MGIISFEWCHDRINTYPVMRARKGVGVPLVEHGANVNANIESGFEQGKNTITFCM